MTNDQVKAGGVFTVQCVDKDGNIKWEDKSHNLVVNEGLKHMNDTFFKGSGFTADWYIGLVTGPGAGNTYAANDTMAFHPGWTEFTAYTGNRGAITFDAATLADPSVATNSTRVTFNPTGAGGTVAGAFLTDAATGTSGKLFSVVNFQTPGGDRSIVAGDVLYVTYTFSLDAA